MKCLTLEKKISEGIIPGDIPVEPLSLISRKGLITRAHFKVEFSGAFFKEMSAEIQTIYSEGDVGSISSLGLFCFCAEPSNRKKAAKYKDALMISFNPRVYIQDKSRGDESAVCYADIFRTIIISRPGKTFITRVEDSSFILTNVKGQLVETAATVIKAGAIKEWRRTNKPVLTFSE